jgi:hypothetical protein
MTTDEQAAEIERLKAIVEREAEDWAETDTHVRDVAKRFFDQRVIDGDEYGVPTIMDVADLLAAEIERLKMEIDQQIKREAVEDAMQKLTAHQRDAALREIEQLGQQLAEARKMVSEALTIALESMEMSSSLQLIKLAKHLEAIE